MIASTVPRDVSAKREGRRYPAASHIVVTQAPQHTSIKAATVHAAFDQQQTSQVPEPIPGDIPLAQATPPPRATIATLSSSHFVSAPSPPVSLAPGPADASASSTHITPSLQHLADKFARVQPPRYAPVSQSRPIRPLERGYWYMPASSTTALWDNELVKDFWTWLQEFLTSGQAGWGVVLVRVDAAVRDKGVEAENGNVQDDEDGLRQDLRVYCWGEIVEHIYYLLFVASRSKIRNAGARWVDGAGNVVIQMPC